MHYILFLARYGCPLHPLQRAYEQTTVIGSAIEEKGKTVDAFCNNSVR